MASKKFRGKTCVYCVQATANSADHVVCREFFPVNDRRRGLPKAPACSACNGRKSTLEHYLTTILPFGSIHPTALSGQANEVRQRLANNPRLRRELTRAHHSGALRLRPKVLVELCRFIVRGLVWHEVQHVIPRDYLVEILTMPRETFELFESTVLKLGSQNRVERSFANGGLWYRCSISREDPGVSTWHLRLYGTLGIAGAESGTGLELLELVGITAPPTLAAALNRIKRRKRR